MSEGRKFSTDQLSVVDGMIDWVRVVDKNNTVRYANKKMKEDLGDIVGKKCYSVFCQNDKCDYCISNITLEDGSIMKKQSTIGDKTFMVISSPLLNEDGEITDSVEVFRDITTELNLSHKISEKNKKMSDDINFARNMQIRMLPPKGMHNGVKINYMYESSEFLSGDFFDLFKIDEENTGIYICDVVGHGVSASLLTIFVRQSLRTIAKRHININKIMQELHKTFLALNLDYDKYFSVFFGIYNKTNHEMNYVNAGHNTEPILLRSTGEVSLLKARGYPIANIFNSVQYEVKNIKLNLKDEIFFYTDGITEATNSEGKQYGVEKVVNIIKEKNNILGNIKSSLDDYCKVQKDDYAILMVEII